MCDAQISRLTVWDPDTMSRKTIHAVYPHHLPVDGFPGCHLVVEPIGVDVDGPEFEEAVGTSFMLLVAPLRVRA